MCPKEWHSIIRVFPLAWDHWGQAMSNAIEDGPHILRIVLADEHPLVLTALHELFANCPDIEVVGVARDGEQATVGGYNGCMYPATYQAGDTNESEEGCSRGVDCSGFVSRVWGLSTKHGTCTLEDVSWQLSSEDDLVRGDIMNKCGTHVIMFASFDGGNGINGYESTITSNYDRVIYRAISWESISGYDPRRHDDIADSCR